MAKKNFKGVPDDYATNPLPGWGIPSFKENPENSNICMICGIDHTKEGPLQPGWAMSKNNPEHKAPQPKFLAEMDEMVKNIFGNGILPAQQAADMLGIPYKPPVDPVLIKGKPFKAIYHPKPDLEPIPIKQIRIETRIEIPGYSDQKNGYKKHGFGVSLTDYTDITESQLRKILMDGFLKITDDIVKNMKEQNK